MLVIMDSEREIDLQMVKAFSNEIMGENEVMISDSTLKYLNVSDHRKEKVEIVFDFLPIYKAMQTSQKNSDSIDEDIDAQPEEGSYFEFLTETLKFNPTDNLG